MKNADGVEYETAAAVICRQHGRVCISDEEELRQLEKPDSRWVCPRCGNIAEWDDDCPATNPAEWPGAEDERT